MRLYLTFITTTLFFLGTHAITLPTHLLNDTIENDALFDESIVTDNDIVQPDTIDFEAISDTALNDSLHFDLPEGMTADIDSLLNGWQARNLLKSFDCETEGWESIKVSDTLYAERLRNMPCIIDMPYNNMVRTCISNFLSRISGWHFGLLGKEHM